MREKVALQCEGRPGLSRPGLSPSQAFFAVEFDPGAARLWLLDQRRLPQEERYLAFEDAAAVAAAIVQMVVRGAPAIGIAAAYAMALQAGMEGGPRAAFVAAMQRAAKGLGDARPTAVNLAWALRRMLAVVVACADKAPSERVAVLLAEAEAIHREDIAACQAMAALGAADVPAGVRVLTHCNTGALATGGYGTALGVIRSAHAVGKLAQVWADETRPYLQGARLTAWELQRDGIAVTVICDSMAAHLMQRGEVDFVVVGADRIAANGDVANKIGTYALALAAQAHGVPFTVAAPWSTVDLATADGAAIPIEARRGDEVACIGSQRIVPVGVDCLHPAFDVTPARYIDAIYTERGRFRPRQGEGPRVLVEDRP
ncbi:MAG: S-methyl-5-thioribose-1-phosphate isomerase [Polyangiales bacterium]